MALRAVSASRRSRRIATFRLMSTYLYVYLLPVLLGALLVLASGSDAEGYHTVTNSNSNTNHHEPSDSPLQHNLHVRESEQQRRRRPSQARRRTGKGDLDSYYEYLTQFDGNGTNQIVGGMNAQAPVPWYVHFGSKTCSGSLISPTRVLTSATCLRETGIPSLVRVGATNQRNGFLRQVACASIFPGYSFVREPPEAATITGDLAILKLTASVPGVTPVILSTDVNIVSGGGTLFALGIGLASTLQYIELNYVPTATCQQNYGSNGQAIIQPARHLCASSISARVSQGLCTGDSGSPLVVMEGGNTADNAIQVGVASFTYGACGNHVIPDVFTPVAAYSDWIQAQIDESNDSRFCDPYVEETAVPSTSNMPSQGPSPGPSTDGIPSSAPSTAPVAPTNDPTGTSSAPVAPTNDPTGNPTAAPTPPAITVLTEQLVVLAVEAIGNAVEWKQTWKQDNLPGLAALIPNWIP